MSNCLLGMKTNAKDLIKELEELLSKAENGNTKAQYRVGLCFEKLGYTEVAFDWFYEAAEQRNIDAMVKVGRYYLEGIAKVEVDEEDENADEYGKEEGLDWIASAAVPALLELAYCYEHGFGIAKDIREAKHLTELANKLESREKPISLLSQILGDDWLQDIR